MDAHPRAAPRWRRTTPRRGETPGVWVGSGVAGIDGLSVGDEVTAQQMRALFGCGLHPLAEQRRERLEGPDLRDRDFKAVTRLGPVQGLRRRGNRVPGRGRPAHRATTRRPGPPARLPDRRRGPGPDPHPGRPRVVPCRARPGPARRPRAVRDDREDCPGRRPQTVAGYDLTFSPVSRSAPCGRSPDPEVAAQVELAHNEAVADALAFIEKHALFTRRAPTGSARSTSPAWSRPRSRTATRRAGTRTCTPTSRSRTRCRPCPGSGCRIDGRILFKAKVTASETYNTALEKHLRDPPRAGLRRACRHRAGQAPGP